MESLPVVDRFTSHIPEKKESPKRKKPCCACKSTKKLRDMCIRNNNEEVCFDFV